jgi:hypothetical protein
MLCMDRCSRVHGVNSTKSSRTDEEYDNVMSVFILFDVRIIVLSVYELASDLKCVILPHSISRRMDSVAILGGLLGFVSGANEKGIFSTSFACSCCG